MVIKTIDELHIEVLATISDDYEKSPGEIVYDLSRAIAIGRHEIQKLQAINSGKTDIENLTTDELTRYVWQRKGVKRKISKSAIGDLSVVGSGEINTGDLFETEIGTQFKAIEKVLIDVSGTVKVQAVIPGSKGNVGANSIVLIPITIQGIQSITNINATYDGYDQESNESLMERYFIELQKPPTSGNVFHYLLWSREIVGVGNAKVFSLERGPNTVEVLIINNYNVPASDELVAEVQNYIDPDSLGRGEGEAPIGAKCYVISAAALPLMISVAISKIGNKTVEQLLSEVSSVLTTYLRSIAFKENVVSYAQIGSLILSVEGIDDYTNLQINGGMTKVDIPNKSVAILGGVEFV